nr:uncharacterized protein CTRU02_11128 [Colletotrichum truncatum]KAF6786257.1 hypothetical protein CTRU02_11128 [Colletotrichum truncatum]
MTSVFTVIKAVTWAQIALLSSAKVQQALSALARVSDRCLVRPLVPSAHAKRLARRGRDLCSFPNPRFNFTSPTEHVCLSSIEVPNTPPSLAPFQSQRNLIPFHLLQCFIKRVSTTLRLFWRATSEFSEIPIGRMCEW